MLNLKLIKDNTYDVIVPKGVRYMSEWNDFELFDFPYILDKQIPGCGFTEYCLRNNQDLVLCSPRKLLLENKYDQHKGEIYYVINEFEKVIGVDRDLNNTKEKAVFKKKKKESEEEIKKRKQEYYDWLKQDIEKYILLRRNINLPFKIIVTYDSFYLVKGILRELNITIPSYTKGDIQIVVDEFQSIFTDSTFKSSTENNFMEYIKDQKRICFVSATPMMEEYLRLIDYFDNLPYYKLDWKSDDQGRVRKPQLTVRTTKSVISTGQTIIKSYLDGNFESKFVKDENGNIVEIFSKEAVLFLNSVNNITSIIHKLELTPEQINILCANTPENKEKIKKKLGKAFKIGSVPLKGESHKMFTFCTRTVYLGADFYSTNARSFVLSDANIETLAVDISLDLPQILGRQRLKENPWKDEAEFYYKPICKGNVVTKEDFNNFIKRKFNDTLNLIDIYDKVDYKNSDGKRLLAGKYEIATITRAYKDDYVAVNNIMVSPGTFIKKPVLNKLVMIAEQRAFDIQQIDYADRFSVFSSLESSSIDSPYQKEVTEFFEIFDQLRNLSYKLKYFCEYPCSDDIKKVIYNQITEKHFHEYLEALSLDEIKKCGYNITYINKKLRIISFDKNNLIKTIYSRFKVGDRYSRSALKDMIAEIYNECGYEKSPKASDLNEYFELKEIKFKDESNKQVHGFEIIKIKFNV